MTRRLWVPTIATALSTCAAAAVYPSTAGLLIVLGVANLAFAAHIAFRPRFPGALWLQSSATSFAVACVWWATDAPSLTSFPPAAVAACYCWAAGLFAVALWRAATDFKWTLPIAIDAAVLTVFYLLLCFHYFVIQWIHPPDGQPFVSLSPFLLGLVPACVLVVIVTTRVGAYTARRDTSGRLLVVAAALSVWSGALVMHHGVAPNYPLLQPLILMSAALCCIWFAAASAPTEGPLLTGTQYQANLATWRLMLVSTVTIVGPALLVIAWHLHHKAGYFMIDIWIVGGTAFLLGVLLLTRIVLLVTALRQTAHSNRVAAQAARELLRSTNPAELLARKKDEWAAAAAAPTMLPDDALSGIMALAKATDELREELNRDPVTGLLSRAGLDAVFLPDDAQQLLLADLDHYRAVMGRHGVLAAEPLFAAVSHRLWALCEQTPGCALGRLAGEGFVILIPATVDSTDFAATVHHALHDPVELELGRVSLRATIAITTTADTLIETVRRADTTLVYARDQRQATLRYSPEMDAARQYAHDVVTAVQAPEFLPAVAIALQPIMDGDATFALEALARWHLDGQPVSPAVFVPLVVRAGVIVPFEQRIVDLSLAALAALGEPDLRVTVNISPEHAAAHGFPDWLSDKVASYGLTPSRLIIEVIETEDFAGLSDSLTELSHRGFAVYIDDFGTGHSNVLRIQELPVTGVKIAREVFVNLKHDPAAFAALLAFLSALLPGPLVVEGVETAEELATVGAGTLVQGYHFSRPMFLADVPAWLADHPTPQRLLAVAA